MTELMQGFPPPPEARVTLANWRRPPFNRWGFQHVRELIPTADIPNGDVHAAIGPAALGAGAGLRSLPRGETDLGGFRVDGAAGSLDLAAFLAATDTDALVLLHEGRIAFEHYAHGMTAATPHILMSVSKSVTGLVAGILAGRGLLDPEAPVAAHVPEIAGTAWEGARVRHLLDMRAGVAFVEDYLATSGPIIDYRKATLWEPLAPGEEPKDLRSFLLSLRVRDGTHGRPWHYVSPATDLLGWVLERAAGRRYADLVAELLWAPMGAEAHAYVTVDSLGAPRAAGGLCATARDLARVGQLVAEDGGGVVPAAWIADMAAGGDAEAWRRGAGAERYPGMSMRYRSLWYALEEEGRSRPVLFAVGIFGQFLFVDPEAGVVMAKFSSQALPVDPERRLLTIAGFRALRDLLARRRG